MRSELENEQTGTATKIGNIAFLISLVIISISRDILKVGPNSDASIVGKIDSNPLMVCFLSGSFFVFTAALVFASTRILFPVFTLFTTVAVTIGPFG